MLDLLLIFMRNIIMLKLKIKKIMKENPHIILLLILFKNTLLLKLSSDSLKGSKLQKYAKISSGWSLC